MTVVIPSSFHPFPILYPYPPMYSSARDCIAPEIDLFSAGRAAAAWGLLVSRLVIKGYEEFKRTWSRSCLQRCQNELGEMIVGDCEGDVQLEEPEHPHSPFILNDIVFFFGKVEVGGICYM